MRKKNKLSFCAYSKITNLKEWYFLCFSDCLDQLIQDVFPKWWPRPYRKHKKVIYFEQDTHSLFTMVSGQIKQWSEDILTSNLRWPQSSPSIRTLIQGKVKRTLFSSLPSSFQMDYTSFLTSFSHHSKNKKQMHISSTAWVIEVNEVLFSTNFGITDLKCSIFVI